MAITENDIDEQGRTNCAKLKELLVGALNAQQAALQGQSYIWGDRSVTYQDVGDIKRYTHALRSEIKARCQTDQAGKLKKPKNYTGFYRGVYRKGC